MIQILGQSNSEPWIWAWVTAKLVSMPTLPYAQHKDKLYRTTPARRSNDTIGSRAQVRCRAHSAREIQV